MAARKNLTKNWRRWLALLVILVALSRLHIGTVYVPVPDAQEQKQPIKVLSRQLWLHPFANTVVLQWRDAPSCTMNLAYSRSTHTLGVDCLGNIWDPYRCVGLGDLEIHRLGRGEGTLRELQQRHPPRYRYAPPAG